jgi:RNA polymerase sigma factor (sigma-70 family)
MTEEQAYKQYEPMLHKLAWSFHNTTGVDVDELFSEANIAFLKAYRTWKPEKGKLGLRVWVMTQNHLRSYLKKHGTKPLPVYEFVEEEMEDPQNEMESREGFSDILSRLSSEAQDLVQVILSSPEEFMRESARATRGSLTRFLRTEGWPVERIARCFREVKAVLND